MAIYGYARVSTLDQTLDVQVEALRKGGCEVVRCETASGSSRTDRRELATLMEFLRPGDVLLVTRVDRLARSIADLSDIVRELRAKGASLRALEQPFDTSSSHGELTMNLLGVFAQFENALRRERQAEGIARAKLAGRYKGRPPSIDADAVRRLRAQGHGPQSIADALAISRASVYRVLAS
jgi:DNA invertase Pin-like site-specific DNA recombinase